jgi:heme exporter protein CcmB
MMNTRESAFCYWWLVHKDLMREVRSPQALPRVVFFGLVLVVLLTMAIDMGVEQQSSVIAGLLWIAIFFAGTLEMERPFTTEHDNECWETLTLYPLPPSVLFFAKMTVNLITLVVLESVLVLVFTILTDVPLLTRLGPIIWTIVLTSIGFAAVGTLIGALSAGLRARGGLLALVLLPLVVPLLLSSAAATRILLSDENDTLWLWLQVLAAFAMVFTILGALTFEFILED